jgi:hypothetical protein
MGEFDLLIYTLINILDKKDNVSNLINENYFENISKFQMDEDKLVKSIAKNYSQHHGNQSSIGQLITNYFIAIN